MKGFTGMYQKNKTINSNYNYLSSFNLVLLMNEKKLRVGLPYFFFEPGSRQVVHAGLELTYTAQASLEFMAFLLPQPSQSRDYRLEPPYPDVAYFKVTLTIEAQASKVHFPVNKTSLEEACLEIIESADLRSKSQQYHEKKEKNI